MKRRLYLSVSTMLLAIVLLLGVSFALLSDEVEYSDNFIKVGNVDVESSLTYEGEVVDNIVIGSLVSGQSVTYDVKNTIESDTKVAYRYVIEFEQQYHVLKGLEISVDNKKFNYDCNYPRATTKWTHDVDDDFNNTIKFYLKRTYSSNAAETCKFTLKLEAIQDDFIEVSNQGELDAVEDGDYVILADDFKGENITISKNIYIDLNEKEFDSIAIRGGVEVELENGEYERLHIDPIATVYYNKTLEKDDDEAEGNGTTEEA